MSENNLAEIVKEFCAAFGDGRQAAPDVDKLLGMFAEDGEWVLIVPGGPTIKGRDAIRAEFDRQKEFASYMHCEILRLVASGSTVVTERLDNFTMHDRRINHALTAVFDFDDEGKIVSWREYFDMADMAQQLGIKPDDVIAG